MDPARSSSSITAPAGTPAFFSQAGLSYEAAFGHDEGMHRILTQFLSLLPSPTSHADGTSVSVLDCGSGTGKPVAAAVAASGRLVYGIDSSPTMIELSRRQVGPPLGTFECCDMREYDPSPTFNSERQERTEGKEQERGRGYLDGIVANLSLFYLSRREHEAMAQKWITWLRPGGYLLLGVLSAEDCPRVRPEMYNDDDGDGECAANVPFTFMGREVHITVFTHRGWRRLVEKAGFEVAYAELDNTVFRPLGEAECDPERHLYVIARKPIQ